MTRRFSKQAAIKATDDDERIATAVALRPNELDRQADFLDPNGVENFHNPDPDDGVMHAAFPSDHAEFDRVGVLEEDEEIDGAQFYAGDLIVRKRYHDDQRWQLVKSGALSSVSIGGSVDEALEYDSFDDLPDEVEIPDVVSEDSIPDRHWPPMQLLDGTIEEISDVDLGAVTSADFAAVKDALGKSPLEAVQTEDEFVRVMGQRGTMSEDQARETWDYLEAIDKSAPVGKAVRFGNVGGDPFEDVESFESFLDELNNAADGAVRVGDTRWPADDFPFHDAPVSAEGISEDEARQIYDDYADDVLVLSPPSEKAAKQDSVGVDVFRVVAPEGSDYDRDLLAIGVDFPAHEVYVDWHLEAHGDDQLDNPHVSIYGSLEDLDRVTDGSIEMLGTVDTATDGLELLADSVKCNSTAAAESAVDDTHKTDEMSDNSDNSDGIDDATKWRRFKSLLFPGSDSSSDEGDETEKAGRTLSAQNVAYAKAIHDYAEKELEDARISRHSPASRTYDADKSDGFELSSVGKSAGDLVGDALDKSDDGDDEDEDDESEDGDESDDEEDSEETEQSKSDDMTDDTNKSDDPLADAPEWAKALHEQTEKNAERIDEALDKSDDTDDEDDAEKALDDAPEWAKAIAEKAEKNADRIEEVATQSGGSDQIPGTEKTTDESEDSIDDLGKLLS